MARLESTAKAGYYPTPPPAVERIAALIRPASHSPRQVVRLLDPCCGTSAALRQLADVIDGETYGVESARDRALRRSEAPGGRDATASGDERAVLS
jgi:type I restriction-modification system DNA methylase subunit